ncbi:unnamed protein product [Candida verbasci]|uniref:MHD domain-containing protein n=1 Tax=Candida verbasci TaxID=1227364 RepID=A0A9W4XBM5_9ASCO|nr:unnamed protein product [Candida verbasci]
MDESYNFATTILTSKTPKQAAQIIPNTVQGSVGVNKDLISWFHNYETILSQYNSQLKNLIQDANKISQRSNVGFNSFPRNWNCLLSAIKLEESNNEILLKNIKLEILNPLRNLIDKDVRISELLVNGQELQEISENLDEYQWNFKAPQGFQNLEDFKKIEIQTLFNIVLNFIQLQNNKLTKELKNNENSTNYLLGSFKLDNEMKSQLNYLLNTEFQIPQSAQPSSQKTKRNSVASSPSKTPTSEKRQSRLKSKVGSIFGRKKKDKKMANDVGAIPEDASISTTPSDLTRNTTRRSSQLPLAPHANYTQPQQQYFEPMQPKQAQPQPPQNHEPYQFEQYEQQKQSENIPQPIEKSLVQQQYQPQIQQPDSPNVVKYDNDSDETDNEQSLLQKLDHEKLAPAHDPQQRYSFEKGDDEISTPKTNHDTFDSNNYRSEFPEPIIEKKSTAPAPPPSRKVTHNERESVLFNQRSSSFIQPLQSQDTGNMLGNDFKHFTLNESGLNSSIAEVVNANFKDGQLVKSSVVGEVAFNYIGQLHEPLIVSIPYQYDKLIVNKSFMEELGDNLYRIHPESISSRTLGGLKYLSKNATPPVTIQQIWKYEPHQSSLVINIKSNEPLILENFIVSVALSNCKAISASSKPQGAFNHDKNRITWRYNKPLHLQGEEKLVARFMTQGQGIENEHGVQIKFEIKDAPIKYCTIYENNKEVPTFRNLISGNYSGHY